MSLRYKSLWCLRTGRSESKDWCNQKTQNRYEPSTAKDTAGCLNEFSFMLMQMVAWY